MSALAFAIEVAQMVESVDTRDLKSLGYCSCAGSSPALGTKSLECLIIVILIDVKHFFVLGVLPNRILPNVPMAWNIKNVNERI